MEAPRVTVIGGGFAGVEWAPQLLRRGHRVRLVEMRPVRTTDAHATDRLAEMVCSNSFRSDNPANAVGLLKREMESTGSLILEEAGWRFSTCHRPSPAWRSSATVNRR